MHDYWQKRFGNWADPEIYELARINLYDVAHEHGFSLDADPEVWNEPDWLEFERDREAFESYHTHPAQEAFLNSHRSGRCKHAVACDYALSIH